MKRIFKKVELNSEWKRVDLKKYNDFYLIGIKKEKNSKKSTLDKDCVKKIKFEIAVDSGKKGKYLLHNNQVVLNFNDVVSSDEEFNKIVASTKVFGCPSTFYIRAVDMTGEVSVAHEGTTSIEIYLNEMKLK